ncbi:MAG: CRTAC1 family protein [Planctomycetota bacterium]
MGTGLQSVRSLLAWLALVGPCGVVLAQGQGPAAPRFENLHAVGEAQLGEGCVTKTQGGTYIWWAGGVAVLDFDGDGFMDIFVPDGFGRPNRLFQNVPDPMKGSGRALIDVTAGSGLDGIEGRDRTAIGATIADYDNDGDPDIYVHVAYDKNLPPESSENLLYRNDGGGRFTNVTAAAGVGGGPRHTMSANFADYDNDGDLDLFLGNWGMRIDEDRTSLFYENDGDGTFTEVSQGVFPRKIAFRCLAALMLDIDDDGWQDIYITGDTVDDVVLRNVPSPGASHLRVFEDVTALIGTGVGDDLSNPSTVGDDSLAAMGIHATDYDRDGDLDIFISDAAPNAGSDDLPLAFVLYENQGQGKFTAFDRTPFDRDTWGWGVNFFDYDNDTFEDLFIATEKGYDRWLFHNVGYPTLFDVSDQSGLRDEKYFSVIGSATFDYDNDGRTDLLTYKSHHTDPAPTTIYRNQVTTGHYWIDLRLEGDGVAVPKDAAGAEVRVSAGGIHQLKARFSGQSKNSDSDPRLHYGLGFIPDIDRIEVKWPGRPAATGYRQVFQGPFYVKNRTLRVPYGVSGFQVEGWVQSGNTVTFRFTSPKGLGDLDPAGMSLQLNGGQNVFWEAAGARGLTQFSDWSVVSFEMSFPGIQLKSGARVTACAQTRDGAVACATVILP